jgi:ribonuclease BN (tRNA processing enzyme)
VHEQFLSRVKKADQHMNRYPNDGEPAGPILAEEHIGTGEDSNKTYQQGKHCGVFEGLALQLYGVMNQPHGPGEYIKDREQGDLERALVHVGLRFEDGNYYSGLEYRFRVCVVAGRMAMKRRYCLRLFAALSLVCGAIPAGVEAQSCGAAGVAVQVLGSGGPELQDKRASSSYLVWVNGVPRVLVDAGGGSALRFGESGAQMSQLDVVLFSHFHVDHSGDFATLIKSSWFEDRKRNLPIYGPPGNDFMPSTTEFVSDLFGDAKGEHGAYRYLSELLVPGEDGSYKMQPHDVEAEDKPVTVFKNADVSASAVKVIHGPVPALAWRVAASGKAIVFSGDTNGNGEGLVRLAAGADIFVAHNAVPEGAEGVERRLHMPPSVIGKIAEEAHVKELVLSHRMLRTLGKEEQTLAEIRKSYAGPVKFGNDLDCFAVK